LQCITLTAHAFELGDDLHVPGGVHEFDAAVLANADARLRRFDPAAADALPRRYRFHRRLGLPRLLHIHTQRLADSPSGALDHAQLVA